MTIYAAFLAVMVAITSVQGNPIQPDTPIPQRLARDVSGGNFLRFGKRFGIEDDNSMRFGKRAENFLRFGKRGDTDESNLNPEDCTGFGDGFFIICRLDRNNR